LAVALTGEQEEAIERRRGALLLAANAGSGKTTVLVERFVRAVHEDGVSPGRILAITFTERAAGELRERVRRRLHELGDRGAARETEAAFVSTIHGFCARLLRAHPLAAGLSPGFAVLDEGTAAGLRQEAFDRALAGWMTGPAELDLAAACGVDGLAGAVARAHDELRSRGMTRPRLPAAGLRHSPESALAGLVAAGAALADELDATGAAGVRVDGAREQLERVPLARVGPGDDAGGVWAGQDGGLPDGCLPAGGEATRRGRTAPALGLDELKLHRGAKALKTEAADAYEAARLRCCEARDDAVGVVGLDLLGRLLEAFAERFAGLKRARGALDFDDLELCVRDLLVGDAELRERWSGRFDLLMVDELQDTNPREMSILGALDRGNLFTVGDEFQSIYGFRHADVGIFRRRRAELAAEDGVRALSRNFRSRPALLSAINAAFAPLFGADFVPLVAGRAEPPDGEGSDGEPLVELMLSDSAGWQETAPGEEPGPGPPWRRAEAALLAGRIEELIGTGGARAGEIVVLLRYATAAGVYGQALAERGIPIAAALGGGFYGAQEIADLGAYVRVLANPLDDVALYGVLASPLCGLRADGLAVVGLAARALERSPWEVLVAAGGGEPAAVEGLAGLSAEDSGRLAGAVALIESERRAAGGLGLADLLVRSGYAERGLGGRGAALGRANIQKLLRLAREFEAREGSDLRAFADRLAAGRLGSSREQHAQLAETDAVRLMTVHAAKGLEFPVVCLADLGHGPPIGAPIILTDGEAVGLRLPDLEGGKPAEAFAYTELRSRAGTAALAEEQRIAYVGMTRARERLILSGAAHFAHWPTPGPYAAAIAWLAPAVVGDLAERLPGPTGVSELDLGGARVRLTLTAAGEMPALRDVVGPAVDSRPPPQPADPPAARRRGPRVAAGQISLFDDPEPAGPPAINSAPPGGAPVNGAPSTVGMGAAGSSPVGVVTTDPAAVDLQVGVGPVDREPIQHSAGAAATDREPIDLPAGVAATDREPIDLSAGAGATDREPIDLSAGVAATGREPIDLSAGVAATDREPIDHSTGRRRPADHQANGTRHSPASGGAGSKAAEERRAPASSLPPPSSISYTSLVDHARCGYGYYLRRVLGLAALPPPPALDPAGGYDAAQRGRIVHGLLERLDFRRPVLPTPALVRAAAGPDQPTDDDLTAAAELVAAFARSPLCLRLARAETVRREAGFAVLVGDLLVNGFIDVIAGEADGASLVVDYKTDRIDAETDLAARVAADYDVQRQIYALAALRAGATSVEVVYCFLRRPDQVVGLRYLPTDAARLEVGLAELAGPLVDGHFPVSPRPHRGLCATCPGRPRLCSWDEALTLGDDPSAGGRRQAVVQNAGPPIAVEY
jgi:ATP-dependent exoDNAse (exonuclease V) beta subunit